MLDLDERVESLEDVHREFVRSVGIEFNKLYNALQASHQRVERSQLRTEMELRAFKEEMKEFKDEMQDFKGEMKEFKDEMQEFKSEMQDFKDEMSAFKDEMKEFKDETRQANREMNRRWGELANKMGTLVEDLVSPSLPRIVRECLSEEITDLSIRRKRRLANGRNREFDAIVVTTGQRIGLNSTKSTLRSADVDHFAQEVAAFRELFPEYADYPVLGILASLNVEISVLNYAEKQGLLVLSVGEQIMEIKNTPGFTPKWW